jgi:hypothetical protein
VSQSSQTPEYSTSASTGTASRSTSLEGSKAKERISQQSAGATQGPELLGGNSKPFTGQVVETMQAALRQALADSSKADNQPVCRGMGNGTVAPSVNGKDVPEVTAPSQPPIDKPDPVEDPSLDLPMFQRLVTDPHPTG